MADTNRSLAEILLLLADNTTGDISPQDMRDAVLSLTPAHGSMIVTTPAETLVVSANTPLKAAGVTGSTGTLHDFTMPVDNRLTFNGASPREVQIAASLSMTAIGNNVTISVYLARNGVVIPGSHMQQRIGTGADIQAISTSANFTLGVNDYIELWVENNSDTTNLQVEFMQMNVLGVLT
jgi:hypothetical protein